MLRRGRGRRGLAEIVGTLMLVLIVVSAAVAFSLFVASYQKQLQAEQQINQERSLELLRILTVTPNLVTNGGANWFPSMNFTLASEYINPSTVTSIAINGNVVKTYTVTALNLTTSTIQSVTVPPAAYQVLYPREQATIWINFSGTPNPSSFYAPFVLTDTSFIKIEVNTGFQNDFSRVFLPPSALAGASNVNVGASLVTLLDGSSSFQPEGNATLVLWSWVVTGTGGTVYGPKSFTGQEYEISPALTTGTYAVALTVTNSDGLVGTVTIDDTVP